MVWALAHVPPEGGVVLYNFSMDQPPTVDEYVKTVCKVADVRRWVPSVSYALLLGVSYVIDAVVRPLDISRQFETIYRWLQSIVLIHPYGIARLCQIPHTNFLSLMHCSKTNQILH